MPSLYDDHRTVCYVFGDYRTRPRRSALGAAPQAEHTSSISRAILLLGLPGAVHGDPRRVGRQRRAAGDPQGAALREADLQWVVNAYTVTFAGFLLLGGRAADLLGRRRVFVAGLVLFALASLAGGLAQSQATLIAARRSRAWGRGDRARLAVDPDDHVREAQRATARSASGARWAAPAAPPACCSAASSPTCSAGAGSCSSTSRSGSPPRSSPQRCMPRAATRTRPATSTSPAR